MKEKGRRLKGCSGIRVFSSGLTIAELVIGNRKWIERECYEIKKIIERKSIRFQHQELVKRSVGEGVELHPILNQGALIPEKLKMK